VNADEEEIKKYLEEGLEKPKEHIAGGLAKLAYKELKQKEIQKEMQEENTG